MATSLPWDNVPADEAPIWLPPLSPTPQQQATPALRVLCPRPNGQDLVILEVPQERLTKSTNASWLYDVLGDIYAGILWLEYERRDEDEGYDQILFGPDELDWTRTIWAICNSEGISLNLDRLSIIKGNGRPRSSTEQKSLRELLDNREQVACGVTRVHKSEANLEAAQELARASLSSL